MPSSTQIGNGGGTPVFGTRTLVDYRSSQRMVEETHRDVWTELCYLFGYPPEVGLTPSDREITCGIE